KARARADLEHSPALRQPREQRLEPDGVDLGQDRLALPEPALLGEALPAHGRTAWMSREPAISRTPGTFSIPRPRRATKSMSRTGTEGGRKSKGATEACV